MARDGTPPERVVTARFAEMRYVGQSYELPVTLPDGPLLLAAVAELFHAAHQAHYGQSDPGGAVELVSVRVAQRAGLPAPSSVRVAVADGTPPTERAAYFEELGCRVATPVWQRSALAVGQRLPGPAIVEQADSTTVVYPGQELSVGEDGSLSIAIG